MRSRWALVVSSFVVALALPAQQVGHDRAFWRAKLDASATPPSAGELPGLLRELTTLLGDPDPELRDDLAFSLLVQWLYRDRLVEVADRRRLLAEWQASLRGGIDRPGDDRVLRRSFTALALSLLAALDVDEPWLADAEFDALFAAAIAYLADERDVRGFEPQRGWLHSVAHTADLLKFLARNPRLDGPQQRALWTAVADKLQRTDVPLVHGEDERLARALLALLGRADLDLAMARAGIAALWPAPADAAPSLVALAQQHNQRHVVLSLHALLATGATDAPTGEPAAACRSLLAQMLRERRR